MKEKKTSVITFRTEDWVKILLEKTAEQNKWSVAQTVNEICKKFVANPQPERITVKIKDLLKILEEVKEEGEEKAIEIIIDLEAVENETRIAKKLEFSVLECGGHGCIGGFDPVYEMTKEEISNIP